MSVHLQLSGNNFCTWILSKLNNEDIYFVIQQSYESIDVHYIRSVKYNPLLVYKASE